MPGGGGGGGGGARRILVVSRYRENLEWLAPLIDAIDEARAACSPACTRGVRHASSVALHAAMHAREPKRMARMRRCMPMGSFQR